VNHRLKIIEIYYTRLCAEEKLAEVRINDRDYQRFDTLSFTLPDCRTQLDTEFEVTHIHSGLGLAPGYVILSLRKLPKKGTKHHE